MAKEKSSKGSAGTIITIGAGIAALTAAAYVMFGPEGKKNRKKITGWAVKMKGEIIEKLESAKEITEPVYHQIVNTVAAKYGKLKNINQEDLENTVEEIRKQWKHMAKAAQPKKKAAKKAAKK
ncbi:MAG: hypothetical protein UY07_C0039G0005 [Parcubacteria group bacterium GW2011_GWA1_47_8]|nr:MAG: hypothetical protein UY07_C0039G0005 [Parcubacteria group bacterium GW2011_GWA1_47_8]KKW07668.1 MAG: hypothetical protein UY42_C0009G0041 [Parcubacteria group bacterium GW2011_GWA2_49_16]